MTKHKTVFDNKDEFDSFIWSSTIAFLRQHGLFDEEMLGSEEGRAKAEGIFDELSTLMLCSANEAVRCYKAGIEVGMCDDPVDVDDTRKIIRKMVNDMLIKYIGEEDAKDELLPEDEDE